MTLTKRNLTLTEGILIIYVFFIPIETLVYIEGFGTLSRLISFMLIGSFFLQNKLNLNLIQKEAYYFITLLIASILWSENKDFEQLFRIIMYFVIMLIIVQSVAQKPIIFKMIAFSFSLSSFIVAITSFFGFLTTQERYASLEGIGLAPISLIFAISFGFQLMKFESGGVSIPSYILLFGNLLGIIATGTRASWLATLMVFTLFIFYRAKASKTVKAILLISVISGIVIVLFPETVLFIDTRIGSLAYDQGANRTIIWKVAWEMWKDSPFFGFGYRNFPVNFTFDYVSKANITDFEYMKLTFGGTGGVNRGSHNDFIGIAVELGLVGLLLFVMWLKRIFDNFKINVFMYIPLMTVLTMSHFQDNINQKAFWLVLGSTIAMTNFSKKQNRNTYNK